MESHSQSAHHGNPPSTQYIDPTRLNDQSALLDTVFPGFTLLSTAVYKYTLIDLSIYIPIFLAFGLIVFASKYANTWFWEVMERHLMSIADIRVDDEIYNSVMGWIANAKISSDSRRFFANTNIKSRDWHLWESFHEDDEIEDESIEFDAEGNPIVVGEGKKNQNVRFTPAFGTHYFWYKNRLLMFKRTEKEKRFGESNQEEISISSFGRNPAILKELLDECQEAYAKNDENRTVIYRGGLKPGSAEPTWTRCVSRVSRPFSTVVLDESVKKSLLDDMRDYLHPYTRRWYSNRGIPYRRGYLLHGPPGTGKSSLSFAIAGYFKLKIYIVSLNNPAMSEENLGTLFTELPKQCVVLLEDIDTAGLTHAREIPGAEPKPLINLSPDTTTMVPGAPPPIGTGRISLSALLNILDGVASQEGRVLIMTTNHIEKLDEALIRPGRVDMNIKFDLANTEMINTIFLGIYATLEGDVPTTGALANLHPRKSSKPAPAVVLSKKQQAIADAKKAKEELEEAARTEEKNKLENEKVSRLGQAFADIIPTMKFSPAEVQGYLLKHKRQPEVAVEQAAEWVVKTLADKRKEIAKKAKEEAERVEKEKLEEEKQKLEEEKEKLEAEKTKLAEGAKTNGVKDEEPKTNGVVAA